MEVNDKDLKDMTLLLLDHELIEDQTIGISIKYIANLCKYEWSSQALFFKPTKDES